MNAVGMDVTVTEVTERMGALSLQGPKSRTVLNKVCAKTLDKLKYFRVMENTLAGRKGHHLAHRLHRRPRVRDLDGRRRRAARVGCADGGRRDYGIVPCGILAMDMARVKRACS
jgi:aminomethyltransferase